MRTTEFSFGLRSAAVLVQETFSWLNGLLVPVSIERFAKLIETECELCKHFLMLNFMSIVSQSDWKKKFFRNMYKEASNE